MIKKIFCSVCVGLLVTLFLAQFDPVVHDAVIHTGQCIARNYLGCTASFCVESLNFFSASIVLTDIEMIAFDKTWSWKCKKCEVTCSWVHFFLRGILERSIVMDGFECRSMLSHGNLAIEPHVIAMTSGSFLPIPTDIKSLVFKNSRLVVSDDTNACVATMLFNSSSLKVDAMLRTRMSVYGGTIAYKNNVYSKNVEIDIAATTRYDNNCFMYTLNLSGLLNVVHMNDAGLCHISGTLESGRGRVAIRNVYNSFIIDPIVITDHEIKIESSMPVSYLMRCCDVMSMSNSTKGIVSSVICIDKAGEKVDGHCIVEDVFITGNHVCDVAKIIFSLRDEEWKSRLVITRKNEEYKGMGHWSATAQQGRFEFYNSTPLSLYCAPHWRIAYKKLLCHGWINCDEIVGIYKADTINTLSKAHHTLYGGFSYKNKNEFFLNGLLDDAEFSLQLGTDPCIVCKQCSFLDKEKKELLLLKGDENGDVKGQVMFAFIRGFINTFFHYDVQGEGMFTLAGHIGADGCEGDVMLTDATVRLPETYNFIDGLQAHIAYNAHTRLFSLDTLKISLFTGQLTCAHATALFNEKASLERAYVPFLLDRCLFNIKKDLFAIVSGSLFFSHMQNRGSRIEGSVIIDRAQLKENIFSSVIQKRLFSYTHSVFSMPGIPMQCDVTVETKSPIKVDTAFLQTNAKVNLSICNSLDDPIVSGAITLLSGNLIFPYKPLFIHKGLLTFSPGQLLDPAIELVARNKIKNYDISLQVAGSAMNHHIMLDSTPPLSEEQIMALLLVGSQESSLNSMIPAFIVQNLKNLIFSNHQESFLEKYFAPLLRPFNISLVPSFTDATGRGGLRGMLEISMNDRWKAMIQKNFNLTEDTRVELEFLLSDDITLRAIRDERRDLGGEIEMRWKF